MVTNQADMLLYAVPPYSEEFFNAVHDNAEQLMLKTEYEKALTVLDEVHYFIRKTDQTAQLGYNLILQAIIFLVLYLNPKKKVISSFFLLCSEQTTLKLLYPF